MSIQQYFSKITVCPYTTLQVIAKGIIVRPIMGGLVDITVWWYCPACHCWHTTEVESKEERSLSQPLTVPHHLNWPHQPAELCLSRQDTQKSKPAQGCQHDRVLIETISNLGQRQYYCNEHRLVSGSYHSAALAWLVAAGCGRQWSLLPPQLIIALFPATDYSTLSNAFSWSLTLPEWPAMIERSVYQ